MVSYTVIPRLGNKTTALKHLRPLFKSMLGSYYCEPFLGSGCVLREIKRINPDAYCLVGDCDDLLSNFYIQAFMNTDALVELVNNAPMHENIFNQLKSGKCEPGPLYKAFGFYYCSKLSGPGNDNIFKRRNDRDKGDILSDVSRLVKSSKRNSYLSDVGGLVKSKNDKRRTGVLLDIGGNKSEFAQILADIKYRTYYLSEDYESLIQRADMKWKNYLLYLDPPYFGTECYYSCNTFDHKHLREVVGDRTNVIINYNDCQEARELYKDFKYISYKVKNRQEILFWKNASEFASANSRTTSRQRSIFEY